MFIINITVWWVTSENYVNQGKKVVSSISASFGEENNYKMIVLGMGFAKGQ